eukprot:TRINITY_DN5783_c0_g1_i1.p1 TRINITY_DN5783_c0_g1~~TRINITY_DN5783_c0_g1_i1.p1  ORF type:complete len:765 (-),score=97.28 TRINITY_DN5783_c0_g1_i1:13-2307(-)
MLGRIQLHSMKSPLGEECRALLAKRPKPPLSDQMFQLEFFAPIDSEQRLGQGAFSSAFKVDILAETDTIVKTYRDEAYVSKDLNLVELEEFNADEYSSRGSSFIATGLATYAKRSHDIDLGQHISVMYKIEEAYPDYIKRFQGEEMNNNVALCGKDIVDIQIANKARKKVHNDEDNGTNFRVDKEGHVLQIDGSNMTLEEWTPDIERDVIRRCIVGLIRPLLDSGKDYTHVILQGCDLNKLTDAGITEDLANKVIKIYNDVTNLDAARNIFYSYCPKDTRDVRKPQKSGMGYWKRILQRFPQELLCLGTPVKFETCAVTVPRGKFVDIKFRLLDTLGNPSQLPHALFDAVELAQPYYVRPPRVFPGMIKTVNGHEVTITTNLGAEGTYFVRLGVWKRSVVSPVFVSCVEAQEGDTETETNATSQRNDMSTPNVSSSPASITAVAEPFSPMHHSAEEKENKDSTPQDVTKSPTRYSAATNRRARRKKGSLEMEVEEGGQLMEQTNTKEAEPAHTRPRRKEVPPGKSKPAAHVAEDDQTSGQLKTEKRRTQLPRLTNYQRQQNEEIRRRLELHPNFRGALATAAAKMFICASLVVRLDLNDLNINKFSTYRSSAMSLSISNRAKKSNTHVMFPWWKTVRANMERCYKNLIKALEGDDGVQIDDPIIVAIRNKYGLSKSTMGSAEAGFQTSSQFLLRLIGILCDACGVQMADSNANTIDLKFTLCGVEMALEATEAIEKSSVNQDTATCRFVLSDAFSNWIMYLDRM